MRSKEPHLLISSDIIHHALASVQLHLLAVQPFDTIDVPPANPPIAAVPPSAHKSEQERAAHARRREQVRRAQRYLGHQ
jgi:hypothetical protein